MSRRESLVGGEVVAEDAAEQAEKKRKQDEQRTHARSRRKRRGSSIDTPVTERSPRQRGPADQRNLT